MRVLSLEARFRIVADINDNQMGFVNVRNFGSLFNLPGKSELNCTVY